MPTETTFFADFRKFFGRGLAILLPSILTLWIIWQLVVFVYSNVGEPINRGIRLVVIEALPLIVGDAAPAAEGEEPPSSPLPAWYTPAESQIRKYLDRQRTEGLPIPEPGSEGWDTALAQGKIELRRRLFRQWWSSHWYLEATGLLVAIVLIYLAGMLLGNLLGRRLYLFLEHLWSQVPGFKQIYPHVKQVVDLILGEKRVAFSKAVLIEYPRKGIWTVGLVTGHSMGVIREHIGKETYSIFISSTPAPFTGFTITVPIEDTIELPISIDQAMRFIITAGVLSDDSPSARQGQHDDITLPPMPAAIPPIEPTPGTQPDDES